MRRLNLLKCIACKKVHPKLPKSPAWLNNLWMWVTKESLTLVSSSISRQFQLLNFQTKTPVCLIAGTETADIFVNTQQFWVWTMKHKNIPCTKVALVKITLPRHFQRILNIPQHTTSPFYSHRAKHCRSILLPLGFHQLTSYNIFSPV